MTFKQLLIRRCTKEQLLQQLADANIQFNKYAYQLFEYPFCMPEKREKAILVKVSLSGLGLKNPCSLQDVADRAAQMGLKPCPLYLAAFLRLSYLDQPEGTYLTIASIPPGNTYPTGFYLRNHDGVLWLRGYQAIDSCEWPADNEFVFLKA